MLKIDPISAINFKSVKENNKNSTNKNMTNKNNKGMLVATLTTLSVLGFAVVGFKKVAIKSYEDALKKAGLEIKDNIAIKTKSGEKYTGKLKFFNKSKQKETVEFVDGQMIEKLYYSLLGKELEGYFYKDGQCILQIRRSSGQIKNSKGFTYRIEGQPITKPEPFVETEDGFAWARNFLKQQP